MGKFRGKGRRGRGGGGGGGRDGPPAEATWRNYPTIEKENERLENFYNTLLQLPAEEKEQYWTALKRELPNSFRFCGSKGHALAVKRLLQDRYIPQIVEIEHQDGRSVDAPLPVPWYPDQLAWWMTTPKNVIRKFPPFAAFQKFLVSETSVGNISRQEVVSMIPPLLIDLRPGMTVLDMCAAPGSKAAQLLEMVHIGEEARVRKTLRAFAKEDGLDLGVETQDEKDADLGADPSDAGRATGLLIANDSDYKRGHMLVHQLKRLSSPNLLVTNHDATQFPSIKLPALDPASTKQRYLKFDRILADVPCSGDGTLRKNVNLWKDWQPGNALGMHVTQVRILVRALQLLKVGGRVVYSTCSMNPVENESVIAAAVERCGGTKAVEILDCSDKLPELKRTPGMTAWKIMDKAGKIWGSWEEVIETMKAGNGAVPGRVSQTMFPPLAGSEFTDIPLERCMRVYPHMQDTGAFFITVLEKKTDFKAKNENEPKQQVGPPAAQAEKAIDTPQEAKLSVTVKAAPVDANEITGAVNGAARDAENITEQPANGTKRALESEETEQEQSLKKMKIEELVDPPDASETPQVALKPKKPLQSDEVFKYLAPDHPVIENIKSFYSLSTRFPEDRYMVRNEMGEPAKAIYYTTGLARDILTENVDRGVKFIHGGVRMFMKQDAPSAEVCRWRIQSEGMSILQGYVGEPRVVHLRNKETFRKLLIEMFPRIADGKWAEFNEIGERVRDIGMGCCVLRVEPSGDDPEFTERMALPLWKSIHSLNLMLPKEDRSAMLLRVFNDSSPLINMPLQKDLPKAKPKEEPKVEPKEEIEVMAAEDTVVKADAQEVEEAVEMSTQ